MSRAAGTYFSAEKGAPLARTDFQQSSKARIRISTVSASNAAPAPNFLSSSRMTSPDVLTHSSAAPRVRQWLPRLRPRRAAAQVPKRDQLLAVLVPQHEPHAPQALQQGQPADV